MHRFFDGYREELLGIPRSGKDVDWSKEVPQLSTAVTTLPPPIKLDLSGLLSKLSSKKTHDADTPVIEEITEGKPVTKLKKKKKVR